MLFSKRNSIFARIFVATIIPLILIFIVLTTIINSIIEVETEEFAKETTRNFAERLSTRIENNMTMMANAVSTTQQTLEALDFNAPNAMKTSDSMLLALLKSVPDIYNAWFAFEPGSFWPDQRYLKSYVKHGPRITEIFDVNDAALDDEKATPWYNIPLRTGDIYFDSLYAYDHGLGEGKIYTGAITYPIKKHGRVVGCVGVDMRYDQMLTFIRDLEIFEQKQPILLISQDKEIVFSTMQNIPIENQHVLASSKQIEEAIKTNSVAMAFVADPETKRTLFVCLSPLVLEHADKHVLLYIELPAEVLTQKASRTLQTIAFVSLMGFLILAATIFFTTRSIVNPIKKITDKANKIADGKLDIDFSGLSDDSASTELHTLYLALKSMIEQLAQIHDLKLAAITAEFEREKMKTAALAKTQFFASMSHEIRTPMNAITGLSELLLNEELGETQRKYVQDIKVSAVALLKIINDILDSAKMEAGKLELLPTHYRFPLMLDNICSIIELMAREKWLRFEFTLEGPMPECLFGDAERLRQVLLNILNNAVKYTPNGYVNLRLTNTGEILLFEITDSGIGIKEDVLPFIFDPYSQVGGMQAKQIEGTGLGLSITQKLVKMMQGEIHVESEFGKGSTFYIRIPCVPGNPDKLTEEEQNAPITCGWKAHVLVVDDNRVNLNVAKGLINLYGISCDVALSGKEGIERVRQTSYDLIFMDHMMPDMDGIQTTAAIRAMGGVYSAIPIIALTANAMPGTKELLMSVGMNDYLAKPIEIPALRNILSAWLPEEKKTAPVLVHANEAKKKNISTIIDCASDIQGLDVALGLDRVCGQHEVYETSLRLCAESLTTSLRFIRALCSDKDMQALYAESHALKGSLANIGATELAARAQKLEEAAKASDFLFFEMHFENFFERLLRFSKKLNAVFASSEQEDKPKGDPELFIRTRKQLEAALEEYNYDAIMVLLDTLRVFTFGQENDALLKEVNACVERFSYDDALEALLKKK